MRDQPSENNLLFVKRSLLLGLLFLFAFTPNGQKAKASHVQGLEIYYECIGPCSVRVFQRGYKGCGAAITPIFGANATWVASGSCPLPTPIGTPSAFIHTEITPVCPSVQTSCTGQGSFYGVLIEENYQDWDYCALPSNCIETISFSICCRNNAITNIAAGSALFLGSLTLNPGLPSCNNSPQFSSASNPYFCQGEAFEYDMGAYDPDGDSLAYSLGPCYSSQTVQCVFGPQFTATAPLGPSWNVQLDPLTGNFSAIPQPGNIVIAVVCVYVEEWRNGVLIGTTSRDITLVGLSCPSNVFPSLTAVQNLSGGIQTSPEVFEMCPGSNLSFDLVVSDPDLTQNQILYWDSHIPGASFSQTGNPTVQDTIYGSNPSGHFEFTTTTIGIYSFLVTVQDDACPVYGESQKLIVISVTTPTLASASIAGCNTIQFQAAGCGGQAPYSYAWSGSNGMSSSNASFNFTYPGPGTYTWQCIITDANSVSDTVIDSITLAAPFTGPLIPGPDTLTRCPNQDLPLQAVTGLATYLWSNASTGDSTVASADGWYFLTATDSTGCSYDDSVFVEPSSPSYASIISGIPSLQLEPCTGTNALALSASASYTGYAWSNGATTQIAIATQPGIYSVTATDVNTCETLDSVEVTISGTNLYGTVTTSTQAPLANQNVFLVSYNSTAGTLTGVDTVMTDMNGFYYFCGLNTITSYFIKAAPDSATYPLEIPTYASNSLVWNNATPYYPASAGPYQVDFSTIAGANPGGPGFIGGLISQGANKNEGPGDPVAGLRIYLMDATSQAIVGHTDTDANGYFSVDNLPFGTYKVIPDRPNVDAVNVPEIALTSNQAQIDSLDFRLFTTHLELAIPTAIIEEIPSFSFNITPNPVKDQAVIQLELPETQPLKIDLYDVQGRLLETIFEVKLESGTYKQPWEPDASPGIYFLRVEGLSTPQLHKILLLGN